MAILRNFKNLFGKKPLSGEPSFFPEDEQTPTSISAPVSKNGPMKAASPEASASDLAAKGTWKAKKAKIWKKGSIILGTFRVLDVMSGGMGYIYIAEHMGWKVKMAIKCPNEVILAHKEYFARVLREADAWISLGLHPHIAYCYYMRQIDGVPNFFIEYVDGGNLRDWIADLRKSDFNIGLDLAVQFCNGMEYAHSSGMIHRDIKPENILLTNDGLIKITDFGIAMFHNPSQGYAGADNLGAFEPGGETRITKLGHVMGSPSYMSIEQWKDSRTVDFRADIYSFGVCMYEMFCGKRPFKKTSVEAQENGEEPLNPMAIRKDMPKRLAHTLLRCVSHDKDKRFNSFSDLGAELTKIYREIYSTDPPHKDVADIGLKADGLNNRAVSYMGLGRYNEARALWEKAIEEDPQHFESIFNYGYLRWQNLEVSYDDFVAKVRELESVRGSSPEYWRTLAWVALESGDRDSIDSIRQGRNHIEEPDFQTAFEEYQKPIFTPYRRINGDNSNADDILSMVIAHDGRTLLTGSVDGGMRLWDITSGNLLRKFSGHKQQVNSVSMSKDGLHAVSASDDKSAIVWDLSKRKALYVLMGHNSSVLCAQVSPDNSSVATGGEDGDVILWGLKSGSKLKTFAGHQGPVNAVRFSPDGRHLVSASDDNSIRLWDVQAGMHMFSFLGHGDSVQDVQFSPNGHYLLSGGADNTVRVWDIEKIAEVRQFKRHNDIVSCVGFSPDGQYIISGGWDKMVSIVKLSTGHGGWQQIHTDKVTSVCFMPGGNYAFSSGHNGKITIWKHNGTPQIRENIHPFPLLCRVQTIAKLGQERQVSRDILAGAKAAIKSGQFKKAYKLLKTGQKIPGYENDREFMDLVSLCANWSKAKRIGLKNAWPLRILKGHSDWVTHVEFTANYRYIVSSSWDQTFRLWDMQNGAQLKQFDKTTNSEIAWNVTSFDFTSDNKVAISGNRNNNLAYLWDFSTGEKMGELRGHDAMVNSVCFSNNHRYALTGSDDKTVRLWDVKSRKEVRRFSDHRQTVFTVNFSPDNKLAVSSSDDATVKLWDLEGNRLIRSFEGHYSSVFSASFSPDGARVLSCSEDGTIRLWDIQTGNEVKRFEGHESWVATASFSPDGRFILSGSKDSTIRVWDVASGREVHKSEGHSGWVTCLKFSHDGRFAVSGGWDNNVILWEFDWDWEI